MPIHQRGEVDKTGEIVPRGFVQVLGNASPKIGRGSSGRKELASWVASEKNPLTARVYANRVWLHLFGKGLVTTPDDFGSQGAWPTHPELLDWLALEFVDSGWDVKAALRQLVRELLHLGFAPIGLPHPLDDLLALFLELAQPPRPV